MNNINIQCDNKNKIKYLTNVHSKAVPGKTVQIYLRISLYVSQPIH